MNEATLMDVSLYEAAREDGRLEGFKLGLEAAAKKVRDRSVVYGGAYETLLIGLSGDIRGINPDDVLKVKS